MVELSKASAAGPIAELEASDVSVSFGAVQALRHVSLSVHKGEIVGLIGPNGAGKTTLVNLVSGTLTEWMGDVKVHGRSIRGLRPDQVGHLGIGRTFQVAQPLVGMTAEENVMIGAMFGSPAHRRSVKEARASARQVLNFVGLGRKADVAVDVLNVPERKRLEMARALAMDAKLLLLDEVMAGLNPTEVGLAVELIRRIRESGVAVLVIEHVMKAIVSLCDRVVVLHHGAVIMEGATLEVLRHPQVVEAYMGRRTIAA